MLMSLLLGLRGYDGEGLSFIGGKNAMFVCRTCCRSLMKMHAQPYCSPPNPGSNLLVLEINYLWIPIRGRKLVLLSDRISKLCVNDSQILLMASATSFLL